MVRRFSRIGESLRFPNKSIQARAAILIGRRWLPYSGAVDPFKLGYN
jgi:hypothetical protein